ncbi:MAG: UDP-N-acetylmuramoyl-tripeptide-D-alanyl-D-alanine ligase [Candidatus Collierbacteria bacterium GW2011_GWA1_42_60]|uniref:UDP-N-acetylmuramoyl-tripeptide-D-alanyl-D-alanine ligase n=1 Tax=Candidatus Collierbacteria bacterium GW2011_GWA2_42_17 TaxID=1618378 RepID=A0A0G1B9M9_9BACT|nr:MAG: UDP-N-acetylmuramoyl-tripeptide-D-alanyl-D-alanine ligase [Candidatus Collierbacteria bacterium GW2011_GWB2_42_12]KKS43041.1 MAG: UDP-N-acetylmuramoyl-tripeptide-D-alanyl-D-alanine ligase [Candidatus Collierbacteria bacterium GW2011_GWA2_42_17]KKS62923.1 MAG: UDP-N-acetylmuramoyl-tripeptide-D-alanyl-D-alanine ligase [Candidatus Collierbacteria bacterium GW2011_GWE2_42_48]KKS63470.1 MAG: UDP-N-acetylmuramoyl-tripeptide-D-alanyl-D-alanine ligase [Candidatus Collierbacteria bacterium GW2011
MFIKPFKTHLTIFQQEGYSVTRFFTWWLSHPVTFTISSKKPLDLTPKARLLTLLSYTSFAALFLFLLVLKQIPLTIILMLSFFFTPYLYLFLAITLITPYEKINRKKTIKQINTLIRSYHHLSVIGVTGSFGKTSVKDFLYSILTSYQQTVKTPESYNTIFGIAKVVKMEIFQKTRRFICEMGAYTRGEIAEICHMVDPQYAILTSVGSQHLERFKTLENTTLAKFELVDVVQPQNALVNLDNPLIKAHLTLPQYRKVKTYSLTDPKADFFVEKYTLTPKGIRFRLVYRGKPLDFVSPLFGTSNLYNLVAAISMSLLLKVPLEKIKGSVASLKPSPHRLDLKRINRATLIDNAFSSNEEGFTAILNDLKNLKGKKVLLTPGIIELGPKMASVHQKLGQLAAPVFDHIILVGQSERTKNFEIGVGNTQKISYLNNATNLWPIIQDLSKKYDWILLENDLPDNC